MPDDAMAGAREAAAGLVDDMAGLAEADVPQVVEQAAEQEEVIELDLTPDLPEDLQAEINLPDFEEEAAPAYTPEPEYEAEEYEDEAVTAERNKRIAAEKKLAWIEAEKLKADRLRWVEKDLPHFPALASFPKIAKELADSSTSRRDFGRKAQEQNQLLAEGMKGYVEKVAGNMSKQAEKQQEELAEAWGRPTAGPGYVPAEALETAVQIQKVRKAGSLLDATRARLGLGRSNPNDPHGIQI
jgi:hypothetical protein